MGYLGSYAQILVLSFKEINNLSKTNSDLLVVEHESFISILLVTISFHSE